MALTLQALKEVIFSQYTAQCRWNRRYLHICWKKVMNVATGFRNSAAAAKSLQSCPTLCNTIDGSPPGSPVPGILQARTLEWVAISFSNAWKVKSESEVTQSCSTLSDPIDRSLPGSSVHGIFQARVLEWGAIAFSSEILCISKRNESSDSNRYLHTHDHRSTLHNSQRVEVTLVLQTASLAPPQMSCFESFNLLCACIWRWIL